MSVCLFVCICPSVVLGSVCTRLACDCGREGWEGTGDALSDNIGSKQGGDRGSGLARVAFSLST